MRARPEIVIDARMCQHSGIGTFIRNVIPRLVSRLSNIDWSLMLPNQHHPEWLKNDIKIINCKSSIYSLREQISIPLSLREKPDLFWSPHYNIPWALSCPLVVTVHDLNHLTLSPSLLNNPLRHIYPRLMFSTLSQKAQHIFCVSSFTENELLTRYPQVTGKISHVHNGVDLAWFEPEKLSSPHHKPYLLFIGSVRPHKNLKNLLLSFAKRSRPEELDLLVVGPKMDFLTPDPESHLMASQLGSSVKFIYDVPDDHLKNLLQHATALVFPSFYEGFGLPALEAIAAGCPVICSDLPSLREIGNSLFFYFNPNSIAEILSQIEHVRTLAETERNNLISDGIIRAKKFSWDTTAEIYAQKFCSILGTS